MTIWIPSEERPEFLRTFRDWQRKVAPPPGVYVEPVEGAHTGFEIQYLMVPEECLDFLKGKGLTIRRDA